MSNLRRSRKWTLAFEQAIYREFSEGIRDKGLRLRSDIGSQPTPRAYVNELETLEITGVWIGINCPEQNEHVESLIGTLK